MHCWLQNKTAQNRYARFLIMVITCLETVYDYEVASAYFQTYHNVTADAFSRVSDGEARTLAKQKGLEVVDLVDRWAEHLDRGSRHWALVWEGQSSADTQVALQLAERRRAPQKPRELRLAPGQAVVMVEWRGALGSLCKAGAKKGAIVWMIAAPGGPGPDHITWPTGVAAWQRKAPPQVDIVTASLTNDEGEEARRWARSRRTGPARVGRLSRIL